MDIIKSYDELEKELNRIHDTIVYFYGKKDKKVAELLKLHLDLCYVYIDDDDDIKRVFNITKTPLLVYINNNKITSIQHDDN